jgi:hypothetical protein
MRRSARPCVPLSALATREVAILDSKPAFEDDTLEIDA